ERVALPHRIAGGSGRRARQAGAVRQVAGGAHERDDRRQRAHRPLEESVRSLQSRRDRRRRAERAGRQGVALIALVIATFLVATLLSPAEIRGRQIFLRGTSASGREVRAVVAG